MEETQPFFGRLRNLGPSRTPKPVPEDGPLGRRLRRYGILFFALAALLPFSGCFAHPEELEAPTQDHDYYDPDHRLLPPVANWVYFLDQWTGKSLERVLEEGALRDWCLRTFHPMSVSHFNVAWTVFALLPLWVLARFLARRKRRGWHILAGLLLWGVSLTALGFIGHGLYDEMDAVGPKWLKPYEATLFLVSAACILLVRPPNRRGLRDVEAAIGTQALCALCLVLWFPFWEALEWMVDDGHGSVAVARALWTNYLVGFWVTVVSLTLIVLPTYFDDEQLREMARTWVPAWLRHLPATWQRGP